MKTRRLYEVEIHVGKRPILVEIKATSMLEAEQEAIALCKPRIVNTRVISGDR